MCGRFSQTATPEVIAEQFAVSDPPLFQPRHNIAPSQQIAAIRIDPDTTTRKLVLLRWGLIPSWAKDPKIGNQCINAKAETVAEKPSFRSAFKKQRCLKTLAKIANRVAKRTPDTGGVFDLLGCPDRDALLDRVAVEDVWGIGPNHARL